MEFHISKSARELYNLEKSAYSPTGNLLLQDFHDARYLANQVNQHRPGKPAGWQAKPSEIAGIGLIEDIFHAIFNLYRRTVAPEVLHQALTTLYDDFGKETVEKTLATYAATFPSPEVFSGEQSATEYLKKQIGVISARQLVIEEMLLLWLANSNPAFVPYADLFSDKELARQTAYSLIIERLKTFFEQQPRFGPDNQTLLEMLQAPANASPNSIEGQLAYIRQHWESILGDYIARLLKNIDLFKEENKQALSGPGPINTCCHVNEWEEERFSEDKDWMPKLVLLAKNTYVWLDQLSKKYKRSSTTLDQIAKEEFKTFSEWGITGLWLIGLWERSSASRKIKQACGNQDAVSSAYSLYDYVIAQDLGGEQAYRILKQRAWQYGIRLAADMVPNHVGIYSKWVVEHPDWFISLDYSPFPSYSFNGPDLSDDSRVGIFIEDHYYEKSDAAVVFKRTDKWTGNTKFIYHGNDGTSMPWNDTAQLNYLNPQVREAVIETILHVARKFPVIRFDAAMTLTKKHYQRLWFPEPGSGGDIPTRSEFGMTKEEFDKAMPNEFWREVVDRVAKEAPDTLLLAEAFWLMESYFVRTLGMHRVYNSAFMNMLRDEKNAEYRNLLKTTLEFDPQILKRYVNFMNNPDEETAVTQFGKGDKYFGICTLLVTLPGLPMLGHGQLEGLTEKYGMEFKKAYWNESIDNELLERHKREIFPLLHKRTVFADVPSFRIYDFYTGDGKINENVIAFSNKDNMESSLVIFHNKWAETAGWIKTSAPFMDKTGSQPALVHSCLGENLGLTNASGYFTIFKDHSSGLEFIRSNKEISDKGFYFELKAYEYHVFLDFREVQDTEWDHYAQLNDFLHGRGVPDITEAYKELLLQPIHYPFRELANAGMIHWLMEHVNMKKVNSAVSEDVLTEVEQKALRLFTEIANFTQTNLDAGGMAAEIREKSRYIFELPLLNTTETNLTETEFTQTADFISKQFSGTILEQKSRAELAVLFLWLFVHLLGKNQSDKDYAMLSRKLIDEWMLGKILTEALAGLGITGQLLIRKIELIKLLTRYQNWCNDLPDKAKQSAALANKLFNDKEVLYFIHTNRYQGVLWFNKEAFEELTTGLLETACLQLRYQYRYKPEAFRKHITGCYTVLQDLLDKSVTSGYRVASMLE